MTRYKSNEKLQSEQANCNLFSKIYYFYLVKCQTRVRSQIVTSSWGGIRYLPMVFTEQGVAMLSSVLKSKKAIAVNIQIMRIFTRVRQMLSDTLSLKLEIEEIKQKVQNQDENIKLVFSYLDELIAKQEEQPPRKRIGFKAND